MGPWQMGTWWGFLVGVTCMEASLARDVDKCMLTVSKLSSAEFHSLADLLLKHDGPLRGWNKNQDWCLQSSLNHILKPQELAILRANILHPLTHWWWCCITWAYGHSDHILLNRSYKDLHLLWNSGREYTDHLHRMIHCSVTNVQVTRHGLSWTSSWVISMCHAND